MKEGSRTAAGVLKDSETIQSTGISASATTTTFAVPQPAFWRGVVVTAAMTGSPLFDVRAGGRGAEALDEYGGDDHHTDEDQDGDRGPDPQDRRFHQRHRDPYEALPGGGAVHLGGLLQVLGHQGEPGQQQQPHERRRLPDLRQDDHGNRLVL